MGTRISGRATFGGLASGLDTNALLEGLLNIERQPLKRMESRRAEVDNQRSLVRQLNTKLLALRDAARGLDNRNTNMSNLSTSEEFLKYQGSSTNDDIVEVTAGKGASAGDIQIRVEQLARGSRRFSTPFTVGVGQSTDDAIEIGIDETITDKAPAFSFLGFVLDQDMANMPLVQQGMKSADPMRAHSQLGTYQESFLQHWHALIDARMAQADKTNT